MVDYIWILNILSLFPMAFSESNRIFVIKSLLNYNHNMTEKQQKAAAAEFARRWEGKGYEKGESQRFWIDLLENVYGVKRPTEFVRFEEQVQLDNTSFIDVMIPSTRTMIEMKSLGKDLGKPILQSDGTKLSPFQQAQRYILGLPVSQHPKWIVTCNFAEFDVYDMENPKGEPQRILLRDLETDYYRLQFLVDEGSDHLKKEMEVSMQAGEIVGRMYDALVKQYDMTDPMSSRYLNILCVRLVFCLYAEDAGVFGRHDMFHDYMAHYETEDMRRALIALFDELNTPYDKRSKYDKPMLAAFPYTNGGLFAEEIDIPQFTDEIRNTLLQHASMDFDWSQISPTIFGGVFESTLNPETRRSGGMHYTSIENIHKVIDPLFMNDLWHEYQESKEEPLLKTRVKKLHVFQDKLASLTFFDPACGSGNFLTETYLSLRRLENEVIKGIYAIEPLNAFANPIKVSIQQFYGIEINDFAVTVATTALWISEAQMMAETERIVHHDLDFLPLKTYANIHEGNALRTDWHEVCPHPDYIIGNPPFVGASMMSKQQKQEISELFPKNRLAGVLDYVSGWYVKAAQIIQNTNVRCAFVSTNSICQGEQVAALWKPLKELFGIHIDFTYRTFRWDSEANLKAHVHCVIVGFSCNEKTRERTIFDNGQQMKADNINAYLIDAPDIYVSRRSKPLCNVPQCTRGNQPTDGGNLIIEDRDINDFINKEPNAKKFIKRLIGATEFINNKKRYCLWLIDATPAELRSMPLVMDRINKVKEMRLSSSFGPTRELANVPYRFRETWNPDKYIVIPRVSSERRRYVPMGFLDRSIIPTDSVIIVPNATLYHFGILESNVHMAWMRVVCGRLKSDYRYSKDVVYNNFPWPGSLPSGEGRGAVSDAQRQKIAQTAQGILDARAKYPDSSLADLYDPTTMPYDLLEAHRRHDRAVMEAYGFSTKMTESECVAKLFEMYSKLTGAKL